MLLVGRLHDWHDLSVKLCLLEHDTNVDVDWGVPNNIQVVVVKSFWGHKSLGCTRDLIFPNIEL